MIQGGGSAGALLSQEGCVLCYCTCSLNRCAKDGCNRETCDNGGVKGQAKCLQN